MMTKDMTNHRSGKLLALRRVGFNKGAALWECRCDCGALTIVKQGTLHAQSTRSCGCGHQGAPTHGMTKSPTYKSWSNMWDRCRNPKSKPYRHYGGRGIRVCARWKKFENFLADMGEKPAGKTLERKENDGNYEPGNCKWATYLEQANNARTNRVIQYKGSRRTIAQWARHSGVLRVTLQARLKRGWPFAKAINP